MNTLRIYLSLACAAALQPAVGQELSGSLTAVGDYEAEVRAHSRQSGLPQRLTTTVPTGHLPVEVNGVPVSVSPGIELQQTAGATARLPRRYRGYLDIAAGSYLNTALSAGYRFLDTEASTFGAWINHTGTALFRPKTAAGNDQPRRKLFDQSLGLYGSHTFIGAGTLSASATYRLGYFNYYTDRTTDEGRPLGAPSQTLNDMRARVAWASDRDASDFYLDAAATFRHFGYRRLYTPEHEALPTSKENEIGLTLIPAYRFGSSSVQLGIRGRAFLYTEKDLYTVENFGVVSLTPSYRLEVPNFSMRLGARVDLNWNTPGFNTAHVAPDVALSYYTDHANLYLKAGGGVEPNTLASVSELDMYQMPTSFYRLPQYSPINATLGLMLQPSGNFRVGMHVSYAIADNTPVSGIYPYYMHGIAPVAGWSVEPLSVLSLKGFSVGAEAGYTLGKLLEVTGSVDYQRQSGEHGWFNGLDRPRWVASLGAQVSPLEGLAIGATYTYRGVRNLYFYHREMVDVMPAHSFSDSGLPDHNYTGDGIKGIRLPDVYDLGFSARYTFCERYTLRVAVDNVLGCESSLCPLMPTEGLTISGGFSLLF